MYTLHPVTTEIRVTQDVNTEIILYLHDFYISYRPEILTKWIYLQVGEKLFYIGFIQVVNEFAKHPANRKKI